MLKKSKKSILQKKKRRQKTFLSRLRFVLPPNDAFIFFGGGGQIGLGMPFAHAGKQQNHL